MEEQVRTNRMVVLLTESEREAIDRLAQKNRLATGTFVRKILLDLADGSANMVSEPRPTYKTE